MPSEITEAMVEAALTAMSAYWVKAALGEKPSDTEAMGAALSAAEAVREGVEGWRTMESAPTLGAFLVYRRDGRDGFEGRLPYGAGNSNVAIMSRHKNVKLLDGHFAFDMPAPTHWMPLPASPALDGGRDG